MPASEETKASSAEGCQKTRLALLWMNLASEPLVALYSLLPFILCKDLNVSNLQLSLFITLRPVISAFSFYWSAFLKEGKGRLVANLMGACALAYLPFLFFPLMHHFWVIFIASGLYQLFSRAAIPSLMEILKRNIPKQPREQAFSLFFLFSFLESGVLGLFVGKLLDGHLVPWHVLFFLGALIGLSTLLIFRGLVVPVKPKAEVEQPVSFVQPWQESYRLLRSRLDFAHFQGLFMVGGAALMIMAPAFLRYYADTLQLSYSDLTMARFVFMAIGVTAASQLWRKGLDKIPLLKLTSWVLLGFGLFPIALLMAQINLGFIYLGFLIYGVAQAGSHLLWHLSGTIFAGEGDSTPFTRVNLLTVGLRGAVFPLVGGLLCDLCGHQAVLVLGVLLCFGGALWVYRRAPQGATSHSL